MCIIKVRKDSLQALLSTFHDIKSSQMNANVWTLMLLAERVTMDKHCSVVNLKVEIRSYFQKYVFFVAAYKWWPIFMYSSCAA